MSIEDVQVQIVSATETANQAAVAYDVAARAATESSEQLMMMSAVGAAQNISQAAQLLRDACDAIRLATDKANEANTYADAAKQ